MTPAEAGAILLEEPDWLERYQELTDQEDSRLPIELRHDSAFERMLREYRRFNCTGEAPHRMPMPAVDAVIALAKMRLFPPRSRLKDIPRDGKPHEFQHDEHVWLINERAWRITAIEANTLFLDSFGDLKQIDISSVKWDKYVEARLTALL